MVTLGFSDTSLGFCGGTYGGNLVSQSCWRADKILLLNVSFLFIASCSSMRRFGCGYCPWQAKSEASERLRSISKFEYVLFRKFASYCHVNSSI